MKTIMKQVGYSLLIALLGIIFSLIPLYIIDSENQDASSTTIIFLIIYLIIIVSFFGMRRVK
ncbi:MAG TPA: hypothetical protein DCM45_00830 [Clostridiales bacterium]|nr:hypothetical protein [Clostridiales bacterium]